MADNRYTIDVILDFKDKFTQSIRDATRNTESLTQALDGLEKKLEQQEVRRQRLADVTTDEEKRSDRLADAYEREFGALQKKVQLTEETAQAQYGLASAARAYADAEKERGNVEERSLVNQNLIARRQQLAESLVESKKDEIDLAKEQALIESEDYQIQVEKIDLLNEEIRLLQKQAKEQERIKEINEKGKGKGRANLERAAEAEKELNRINQEIARLTGRRTQIDELRASIKGLIEDGVTQEYRDDALRLSEAFEEVRLEARRLELQNKETTKSQEEQARVRAQTIKDLDAEAKKLRESGFVDNEVNRKRIKNIEELREAYRLAGGDLEDFDNAKTKALSVDETDVTRARAALFNLNKAISKEEKAVRTKKEFPEDQKVQFQADLDIAAAKVEAEAAAKYLSSLGNEIEFNTAIDPKGLFADIPLLKAVTEAIERSNNIELKVDLDRAQITSLGSLIGGLGKEISQSFEDAGRGVSNFDNLIRGLFTLTIALFFQQILIVVVGLSAALAALASSAIAAGAALGGALASGALQALPALGVLAAFVNRFQNVFKAVQQSNLLQQQESYKGGQAANQQAKSLDGVVAAQERVKEAQDAVTEARRKAREALEDLIISEQRQSLTLESAEDKLQKAIGSGGSFAISQARLDVAEARNRLGRTRTDLRDRRRGGIQGSPEVEDAKKRLADANRALAQARKSADQAGQSISAAGGKLNFLLENLSSAEKRLYQGLLRLQKTWLKFSQTIAAPLINSFTYAVNRVNNILKSSQIVSLGKDISNALAGSFKQAFDFLLSDSTISRIANLGREFIKNLQPLTRIAINLSRIFLDLGELGAPVLAEILKYIDRVIDGFARFTSSFSGRNKIAELFAGGTAALIKFVDLLGAISKTIFALIGPAGGLAAGNKILDLLIKGFNGLTKAIIDPSTKIGAFFRRFFKYSDDIVLAFFPVIKSLAVLINGIFTERGIKNVKGFSDFLAAVVIPALGKAASFVAILTTAFVDFIETVPGAKVALQNFIALFIAFGIIKRVAFFFVPIKAAILFLINNFGAFVRAVIVFAPVLRAAAASIAAFFTGPVGIAIALVGIIVTLIAISGRLGDVWNAIKQTGEAVFASIKDAIAELAKELTGEIDAKKAFNEIYDVLKEIGNVLADVLIPLIKVFGVVIGQTIVAGIKRITAIVRFVKNVVKSVINIFKGLKDFWEGVFTLDGGKIVSGLKSIGEGILGIFASLGGLILDLLKAPFQALGSVVGRIFPGIGKKVESVFNGVINTFIKGINVVIKAINALPALPDIDPIDEIGGDKNNKPRNKENTIAGAKSSIAAGVKAAAKAAASGSGKGKNKGNKKSGGDKAPTKFDNENAESFLTSFNPETVKLSGEITKKLSAYWRTLRREARTAANYVTNRLNDIRKDGGKDIDKFVDQASQNFQRLRRSVRSNMIGVANIVRNQMYLAKKAVYDGAVYMKDALNEALDSVGSNSKVKLSLEAPKRDDRGGQGAGRASGGWIGNRGERGRDAVPTMLGRGEAVLNWQQQKVVEPALYKTYGFGLDDMFSRTKGYHAGGPVRDGLARGGRAGGLFRSGLASWFGGANDSMNTGTALGLPDTAPGIALLNQSTLGKYFRVVSPQGRWRKLRQIDIGPAAWTGKILDITSAALKYFGYNERNFPTGRGIWKVYGPVGSGGAAGGGTGGALANIAMPIIKGGTEQMRELVKKSTKKMVDAANRKLEKEAPAVPDGGSLDVPKGASGSLRAAMALAQRMGLQITSTTGGGHAPNSWHYRGRAFDAAGPANRMAAFFRAALKRYGRNILELFYDPLGGIKNGQSIGAIGDHMDHVHLALARGGRTIQRFAYGGHIKGAPDGQPVPIIAHSGEWVLNKKQQGMVAAAAGLSPNALKGKLGFSGGPTSFAGGGEVKGPTFPTITINTSRNIFDKYINEFAASINKLVAKVLSTRGIERATKKIEKDIERLKKGGTTDAEDKRIEKLKEKLKSLERTAAVEALLSATRKITGTDGEGGALSVFFEGIKRTFDKVSGSINLGAANLSKIKDKGYDKIILGASAEDLDPVKIAEKQAKAQEELRDGLIRGVRVYSIQIEKLRKAANRIGRTKNSKGEVVNRNLDQLIALQAKDQKKLDKLDGDDLSKEEKKRQKQLKDRIAARKKEIDAKTKLNGEINLLEEQRRQREQEIIEAEQARLEAEQKAFEERTKQLTRAVDISDAATNFAKSLADLTGNSGGVKTALDTLAGNAKSRRDTLQKQLEDAQNRVATDPRWQSVVDELQQQVYDAQLAVAQTMADVIDNAVSGIENTFQRAETTRGLSDRMAAVAEKMVAGAGNATRKTNLESKGRDLVTQRDKIAELLNDPNIQGNAKQMQDLRDKIAELDVTIAENTQEIKDLNLQIRQQAVERITGISSRTGGLLGNAGSIFENISRTLGQPNTQNQISLAESLRTALGLEGTNLSAELTSFLADPNSGGLLPPEATSVLQQLLSAFNSGDPGSFATVLQGLSPQIALLESTLGESARGPFSAFIDSLTNNTIAVTDNTANLAELNGLANQPQPFSTTAWTRFRAAIFNGLGDVLPQFDVPQMATGGYITKGGMFELHPGEFVVNANQSNVPDAGDINITVNEANKPLDVTALASRIAFEKRTRK